MPKLKVVDMAGKSAGEIELKSEVFDVPYNQGLIHQIYEGLRANLRRGTADTKGRGEVRGGGKKPWRQKGTGNARHGSRRSPIWKGGGISFGPTPRSYNQALPQKMRHAAMRSALSQRVREENFTALKEVQLNEFKTKSMVEMLVAVTKEDHSSTKSRSLLLIGAANQQVQRSAANIPGVQVVVVENLNLLDVVGTHRILATQEAIQKLEETLS